MKVKDLLKVAQGNRMTFEDELGYAYYNLQTIRDYKVLEIEARTDIVVYSPLLDREETFTGLRVVIEKK